MEFIIFGAIGAALSFAGFVLRYMAQLFFDMFQRSYYEARSRKQKDAMIAMYAQREAQDIIGRMQ